MLRDPASNAFSQLDPNILQACISSACGHFVIKLVGLFVEHQQRPGVGPQKIADLRHDGFQDFPQVESRGDSFAYFVKERKPFNLPLEFPNPLGFVGHRPVLNPAPPKVIPSPKKLATRCLYFFRLFL